MTHLIIIPYFQEEEVGIFLKISDFLFSLSQSRTPFRFLLANRDSISASLELQQRFSRIAPVDVFTSHVRAQGYPEGIDAFFWDVMDHVAKMAQIDGGFALWLEPDMIPVGPGWLDRLHAEWEESPDILVMGQFFPGVYLRRENHLTYPHINGGACYAKDLSRQIPRQYRRRYFDEAIFPFLKKTGRYRISTLFKFSHMLSLADDVRSGRYAVLNGFRQDKQEFISEAIRILTTPENEYQAKELPAACCRHAVPRGRGYYCPFHSQMFGFEKFVARLEFQTRILWRTVEERLNTR